MNIMQGDSYPIPVEITQDGIVITPEMVEDVEVTVGKTVRKTLSGGGVTFEDNTWYFLLSQEESFSMVNSQRVIVRLKYPVTGYTLGIRAGTLSVEDIPQKVVL